MIRVKTMTEWPDEDYTYPLPDVSQYSEEEARRLRTKGMQFAVFGDRKQIESDEEFEVCITLQALWNLDCHADDEYHEKMVKSDVVHNRFLWYHGRRLKALRKKHLQPLIDELAEEARHGPMFDGAFLYCLELKKLRCIREYFSYSFVADKEGNYSFKPWMDVCIRLLEYIVAEGRGISDEQSLNVNVRNVRDIVDDGLISLYMDTEAKGHDMDKAFYGRKIYLRKAERLYYQIRLNKMQDWWEP